MSPALELLEGSLTTAWPCRVHICDLADTAVRRFGSRGDGFGRFLNPVGVAVGEGNILYVCDHDRHEVQVRNRLPVTILLAV